MLDIFTILAFFAVGSARQAGRGGGKKQRRDSSEWISGSESEVEMDASNGSEEERRLESDQRSDFGSDSDDGKCWWTLNLKCKEMI